MAERQNLNFDELKIALMCAYPMERHGGVQEHVKYLAENFRRIGHNVTIIAPEGKNHKKDKNVTHLGKANQFSIKGTSVETSLVPDLHTLSILKNNDPDIIAHQEGEIYAASHIAHWLRRDSYHFDTFHSYSQPNWKYLPWRYISRLYTNKITGRILVSEVNLPFAQATFPGEYRVIPNGVDTKRFNPKNKKIKKFMDGKKNVLYVGRLEDRKGVEHLIDAFGHVAQSGENVRLIIVGDGPNRKNLERRARNISGEVRFEGAVSADKLPKYYATAHVFSSPALYGESQGIVNLEAQASGVPVVSGNNEGYKTAIRNAYDGVLLDPRDTKMYATVLHYVLEHEGYRRRLITNGLQTAQSLDWSNISRQTLDFYREKIEEKSQQQI